MNLGDRMKMYEGIEAQRMLIPTLPIMIRLDGKAFHTYCKGLKKPFDTRLMNLMSATSKFLLEQTGAILSYTQSDEISLVIYSPDFTKEPYFNGRTQKLTSVIAAYATAYFNKHAGEYLPEKAHLTPVFDCRVWNVPNLHEAANAILWREIDATKNSVSAAAQSMFSHKELQGKHMNDMQEMMFQKGINWNDYPSEFKRGTYHQRVTLNIPFTTDEIDKLPAKHHARTNPNLIMVRSVVRQITLPPLTTVENKAITLFPNFATDLVK